MMTLEQFKAARSVLQGVIVNTALTYSPALSRSCGNYVYLKPEKYAGHRGVQDSGGLF